MALVGHMEAGQGPRRDAPHRPAARSVSSGRNTTVPKCKRVREKQGRREDEALSFWPLTRSRSLPFRSPSAGPAGSLARPAARRWRLEAPFLREGGRTTTRRRPAPTRGSRLAPGAPLCSAARGVVLGKPEDPELRVSTSATTTSPAASHREERAAGPAPGILARAWFFSILLPDTSVLKNGPKSELKSSTSSNAGGIKCLEHLKVAT